MPYLGNTPTTQSFISGTDYFNGTGSQTAFTLTRTVNSVNDIEVVINNVVQQPNSAYTLSGTTITFTSAPSSGTQNIYVRYLSTTTQVITPSQNTVSWNTLDTNTQGDLGINNKNRIINGNFYIAQRATSATLTAGGTIANGYATVDRFYGYCTGANVTMAQVAGSGSNRNLLQFTGAASVTAIGCGQRIEAVNSYDLAGQICTLSVSLANSLLTTVTWTAFYANTTDTFGTLASPTRTQIATGTFTVSSTLTRYSTNIVMPAAATTGIEIVFTVGAQTSGTWQLSNVQLEVGSQVTTFSPAGSSYGSELALCQRYCHAFSSYCIGRARDTDTVYGGGVPFGTTMRAVPTLRSGSSFIVSTGSAGAPQIFSVTGSASSADTVYISNSSNNWTANALVAFTGTFEAEL